MKSVAAASVAFKAALKETGEPTTSCCLPYHRPLPLLPAAITSLGCGGKSLGAAHQSAHARKVGGGAKVWIIMGRTEAH
jgi:hypothetical protein